MFINRNRDARRGFTLIEILVVVAIIAILSSVILIGLGPTRKLGRDARRISDLRQVQNGLEIYFNKCGYYPGGTQSGATCVGSYTTNNTWGTGSGSGRTGMTGALINSNLGISSAPDDPSSPVQDYIYQALTGGRGYVMATQLEDASNPAARGQTTINTGAGSVSCGAAAPNGGVWYCVSL